MVLWVGWGRGGWLGILVDGLRYLVYRNKCTIGKSGCMYVCMVMEWHCNIMDGEVVVDGLFGARQRDA